MAKYLNIYIYYIYIYINIYTYYRIIEEFQGEVLTKTPGLYQVPELGNWISKILDFLTNVEVVIMNGHSDSYYPLVADKNRVFSKFHLVGFRKPSFLLIISICT